MTLMHFLNCAGLAFGPSVVVYRATGLRDESPLGKCAKVAGCYLATQFLKILLIATLFPPPQEGTVTEGPMDEVIKAAAEIFDLVCIYAILQSRWFSYQSATKILIVALGWFTAELLASRLLPLYQATRGLEFHWNTLLDAFEGNVVLLQGVAVTTALYLWTRLDTQKVLGPLNSALLFGIFAVHCARFFLFNLFFSSPLAVVLAKLVFAVAAAVIAYSSLRTYESRK